LLAALFLAFAASLPAQNAAQDRARAEAAAKRAGERIRALQQEADALASQEQTLLVELRKLEVERQLKVEQLAQIERDLQDTQRKLADAAKRADALRKTADAERPEVEGRLVQLYKMGRAGYWRLLLDVEDLRSMGRAYRTAAAMTQIDRNKVQQHQRTLAALEAEQKALQARTKEIATLKEEAARARAAIDRAVAARSQLVDTIDARRDLNAQLTSELQAAQQKLQAAVANFDADPKASQVTLPLRPFQGALPWPVRGTVSQRFGRQSNPRFGTAVTRNGIEIAAAEGLPVHPIHDGVVAYADQFTGYGNLVIIEHGDRSYSLYGNLLSIDVGRGDRVDTQTTLGQSGRNPSGNPALYFELRVDARPVDPLQWLKR
jgi:septal ring factor EnvC (AmiA/AmiB activator)